MPTVTTMALHLRFHGKLLDVRLALAPLSTYRAPEDLAGATVWLQAWSRDPGDPFGETSAMHSVQ